MKSFKKYNKNVWYAVIRDDGVHFIAKPAFNNTEYPDAITNWVDGSGLGHTAWEDDEILPLKKMDKITKHFKVTE